METTDKRYKKHVSIVGENEESRSKNSGTYHKTHICITQLLNWGHFPFTTIISFITTISLSLYRTNPQRPKCQIPSYTAIPPPFSLIRLSLSLIFTLAKQFLSDYLFHCFLKRVVFICEVELSVYNVSAVQEEDMNQ